MLTYLTLAYEGNYIGRWGRTELFSYQNKIYIASPEVMDYVVEPMPQVLKMLLN